MLQTSDKTSAGTVCLSFFVLFCFCRRHAENELYTHHCLCALKDLSSSKNKARGKKGKEKEKEKAGKRSFHEYIPVAVINEHTAAVEREEHPCKKGIVSSTSTPSLMFHLHLIRYLRKRLLCIRVPGNLIKCCVLMFFLKQLILMDGVIVSRGSHK